MSQTLVSERKVPNSRRPKKMRQVKSKIKRTLIVFDVKRIIHKELVLAGQSVPHTSVTYYRD
jgi:hypothetical protein